MVAVSYDRYLAIVKSPLTYDGTITKTRVAFMSLTWILPIPLSIGPFLGWGKYVYNPEVLFCEQGWAVQSDSTRGNVIVLPIATFIVPFVVIVFLNGSVYKAARKQINANEVQVGDQVNSESPQQQEIVSRRLSDHKAAVDVTWLMGICLQFVPEIDFPAKVVLATTCTFFVSTLCNPLSSSTLSVNENSIPQ